IRAGTPTRELDVDASAVSTRAPGRNDFAWRRAQVHVDENTASVARRTPVALPAIEIRLSDTGLGVTPYGVQISVGQVERAVDLATLQAVLAEGVPAPRQGHHPADRAVELELVPKASAPGSGAAPAPAGAAGASSAAPRPSTAELAPISAPW